MIKLILFIVGFSGLLPFTRDGKQGMDVVLINAQFNSALQAPAHRAVLQIDGGETAAGPREQALNNVGVVIQCGTPGTTPPATGVDIVRNDNGLPWRGLGAVSDLTKVVPDATPREDLMKGGGGRVVAGLRLLSGRLEAAPPVAPDLHRMVFRLGEQRQAFTDRVQYTLTCPGNAIEFHLRSFDGAPQQIIRVTPIDGLVVATLSNLPAARRHPPLGVGDGVAHFRAVYELLRQKPVNSPVPTLEDVVERHSIPSDPDLCFLEHFRPGPINPGCLSCPPEYR